ncbi:MAG: SDR family NAD(P)-dependent oxidoreductase [Deltaproteobacteria bacterium]|nr:MAG: SDR family NAD(P)-dependent oxidoreductase [Deltaproteobacteria bacterium]
MSRVLILGATSAIAGEVAQILAARGDRLHLVGRNPDKLARLVATLPTGCCSQEAADLADLPANAGVVDRALAALGGLDLVLIAHGDLGNQLVSERDLAEADRIVTVNLRSPISLLVPIANHLEAAGQGRIAVITSVAAERGRPRNYTYGAAKGALNTYLQGLRTRLRPTGVGVTTIKLGPVATPMTEGHDRHLLFATAPGVARRIVDAIDRGADVVFVPGWWAWIMPVVRHLPEAVFQRLAVLSGR